MRPDIDRAAIRYFVYFLRDASGAALYIGRSCNVAQRIRAHVSDATHPFDPAKAAKAEWLREVRSVDMVGPFTWRESIDRERAEIEKHQPRGNIALTARDPRLAVALASRRRSA